MRNLFCFENHLTSGISCCIFVLSKFMQETLREKSGEVKATARKSLNVYIPERESDWMDLESKRSGDTKTEIIKRLIREEMKNRDAPTIQYERGSLQINH